MADFNKTLDKMLERKREREAQGLTVEGLAKTIDRVQDRLDERDAMGQKAALHGGGDVAEQRGPFLSLKQAVAPYFATSAHGHDFDAKNVRMGALVAAAAFGNEFAEKALNSDERKSFLSLTGPGGDYLLPEVVSGPFIDAIRPQTRVLQSGAQSLPMAAQTVRLPGWKTPISAGWAGEFVALPDGGGDFRAVVLTARAVGAVITLSTEMLEDTGGNVGDISARVEAELSRAIALSIDKAALIGAGTQDEPLGLYPLSSNGRPDVAVQSLGTNGAVPANYDFLVSAAGAVKTANFTPNAAIYAPRTGQELGLLKDGQQRYLDPPRYLDDVTRYESGVVPINATKGSSNASSLAFVGQWDQMVVGFRPNVGLRVIRDPFTAATQRAIKLVAWQRADIALLNPTAFQVVDGVN